MMQCYHTWAGESVAEISANTGTGEVSRCVGAVGVWTAASVIHSTFIHICVTTQWVDVDSVSIEHYADHDVSNALRVPVYGKQMCLLCRQRRRDSLETCVGMGITDHRGWETSVAGFPQKWLFLVHLHVTRHLFRTQNFGCMLNLHCGAKNCTTLFLQ